jgi:hypothetical protein
MKVDVSIHISKMDTRSSPLGPKKVSAGSATAIEVDNPVDGNTVDGNNIGKGWLSPWATIIVMSLQIHIPP